MGAGDIRSERDLHPVIGRMVRVPGAPAGEIEALIAVKNDAPTHHFTKFGDSLARRLQIGPTPILRQAPIRLSSPEPLGKIIDGVDRGMNGIREAAVNGAILGAGVAIWLVAGYLIQRFGFRNPEPNYATVIVTSTGASMLLFSLVALLVFHIR